MGYRLVSFSFIPEKNEQMDVIIKIPEEVRSTIHGIVKDYRNEIIKDAVVKLFRAKNNDSFDLEPITHTFTDDHGHFLFGPLKPEQKYVIKVWVGDIKVRQLVVNPDEPYLDDEGQRNEAVDDNDYFEDEEKD